MPYSSLIIAAILARSCVASDNSQQCSVLYQIPNDVAIIIRRFVPHDDQYALIMATQHKGCPFGCVFIDMNGGNEQMKALLLDSKHPFSDMFYNGRRWFTLEYPIPQLPANKPRSARTGRVDVSIIHVHDKRSRKLFSPTFETDCWIEHSEDNYCNWYFKNGESFTNIGPFNHAWLLTNEAMIGYRQANRKLSLIERPWSKLPRTLSEITLNHDVDPSNISFGYKRRYNYDDGFPAFSVQVQRQSRKIEIIKTELEDGTSKHISVDLPKDLIIEQHYLSPAGLYLIVLVQRIGFNCYELLSICTWDGQIKSRVPLMGEPSSIKISPTDRYVLVSFHSHEDLPVCLMKPDALTPYCSDKMLTIVPDSFGCECVEWLNEELFKMEVIRDNKFVHCVRSWNDISSDLCSADVGLSSVTYGEDLNGAEHVYDLDTVFYPGILHHHGGIHKFLRVDWKKFPQGKKPYIYRPW